MADPGHKEDPQLRIRQLERSLVALTKERDDLSEDVAQLCMSRGGHMFSSSYVASERLKFLEGELKEHRQLLASMTSERDSLQEDMWQIKAAKKQSDEGWQQERQHAAALQKELDFFKTSSARAIAERDKSAYEAQSLKAELDTARSALQDTRSQLSLAQQVSLDLQTQLGSVQQQLEAEQQEAAAARVQLRQQKQRYEQQLQQQRHGQEQQIQQLEQGLEQQLEQKEEVLKRLQGELVSTQAAKSQLTSEVTALKATAASWQQQVEGARAAADTVKAQLAAAKAANANLHKQLNSSTVAVQDLQTLLEQTSAALVASQARLKETHGSGAVANTKTDASTDTSTSSGPARSAELQEEIQELKAQLCDAEEQLQQAVRDKLQVQLELSQAQAEEDEYAHTLMQLQQLYHHCKELLASATQQKVEALLQVAKQEARTLASQPQTSLPQSYPQHSRTAPASTAAGGPGSPAFATPPASPLPSMQRTKACRAAGRASSSSASTATSDEQQQHETAAACDTDPAAAADQQEHGPAQQQRQLPVSTPAGTGGGATGIHAGANRLAADAPAEQSAAQLQLQQAAQGLAQLLLLAHHYLTLLQQLPPADVAAAAQGGGSSAGGKGRASGARNRAASPAFGDALARLAAAVQDLDKDRQQLLSSSQLKQQQLDDLLTQLLAQSAGAGMVSRPASAAGAAGSPLPGSRSAAQHSSPGGRGAALGKLLRGAHGSTAAAPTASATVGSSSVGALSSGGGGGGGSNTPASLIGTLAAGSASNTHAAHQGVLGGVSCVSAADLPRLQLALCHEVQLLAECGLNALRYIPNITALSSLMQGSW